MSLIIAPNRQSWLIVTTYAVIFGLILGSVSFLSQLITVIWNYVGNSV